MFQRLLSALPDGNRKFPLRYFRMTTVIKTRQLLAKNRYLLAPSIQTPGMELLRFLVLNLDISELDEYKTDADRYTEVIKFFKETYRTAFDPVFSGSIAGGKWFKIAGTTPPSEIILNSECANPLIELPLGKDWSYWQDLRAMRLVYHDSLELPENFYRSMFEFKRLIPTYFLMSLDVPILLFKYYKYVKDCQNSHQPVDTNYFLKEFEYSRFFDDLYEIWLFNLVNFVFEHPSFDVDQVLGSIEMPIRFCTTNMLREGVTCIKEYADLLKTGAIKPQDFMEIRWFANKSFKERIDELDRWIVLPKTHRYLWLDVLLQFPFLNLFMTFCHMFPESPLTDTIWIRALEIWNTKFRHISMPAAVINPKLGDFIRRYQKKVEVLLAGFTPSVTETT